MKASKLFLTFLIIGLSFQNAISQTSISQAQSVFIYNFTRLIEWPEQYKTGNFEIMIYGSGDITDNLQKFANSKFVGKQPITVIKVKTIDEITKPQILFVCYNKTKELEAIKAKLGNNSTLIITEKNGAIDSGAAINFVIIDDKLKFELKTSNATKIGLKVHSNLETMAIKKF